MTFQKVQYIGKTLKRPYKGLDKFNKNAPVRFAIGDEGVISKKCADALVKDFPEDFKLLGQPFDEGEEKNRKKPGTRGSRKVVE